MAEDKKTLPMIPSSNWWALRKKFLQSVPRGAVDEKYLSTLLSIGEPAAKNLIGPLKQIGLIDESGKATELANSWRHDDTYSAACKTMLDDVYPEGLIDVQPGPIVDKAQAATWISKHLSVGDAASKKMAALYALIVEADPTKESQENSKPSISEAKGTPAKASSGKPTQKIKVQAKKSAQSDQVDELAAPHVDANALRFTPKVHLDIQIHISPDASNEQVEKIFESMGKHLFGRGKGE